ILELVFNEGLIELEVHVIKVEGSNRATIVLFWSGLVRTLIIDVGDSVTVGVRTAVKFWESSYFRAAIIFIGDAVAIGIRAAVKLFESSHFRTLIIDVRDAVTVGVRTTIEFGWSGNFGAAVINIGDAVAVGVRTTVNLSGARRFRTTISFVGNAVPVGVRTTVKLFGARCVTTPIVFIGNAVAVGVFCTTNVELKSNRCNQKVVMTFIIDVVSFSVISSSQSFSLSVKTVNESTVIGRLYDHLRFIRKKNIETGSKRYTKAYPAVDILTRVIEIEIIVSAKI